MSRVNLRCLLQRAALPTMGPKDLLIKVKWKFQNIEFEKKGIRNQAAEQFKIERAAGQGGV